MIPTTTWTQPKNAKKTDGEIPASRKYDQRHLGGRNEGKYLTARTIPGSTARRKIDYIVINSKYRNTERTAQ